MLGNKLFRVLTLLNNKSVLITGGTGSFGQKFAERILLDYPGLKRLVIFSRDELKQYEMSCKKSFSNNPKIRFFIGDIRDSDRLRRALENIDVVIHAAALKQVPAAEYNPFECIKTNVIGAQNLIEACLDTKVSRVVALSTDKAAAPINLYGATKLCSDKLFTAANSIVGERNLKFSVVRYGNVMGSRGSVIPFFLKMKTTGVLPITDPKMTRFNISLDDGVSMVLWSLENMEGGEIFVPKIPSYKIMDVAEAICSDCQKPVVGIRPGEKLHEEMITESDSHHTVDLGKYFAILPSTYEERIEEYAARNEGMRIKSGHAYQSDSNPDFLSVTDLKQLIEDIALSGE
jgi:UDP-N-acetylglucosamine 4,6-dehydratase